VTKRKVLYPLSHRKRAGDIPFPPPGGEVRSATKVSMIWVAAVHRKLIKKFGSKMPHSTLLRHSHFCRNNDLNSAWHFKPIMRKKIHKVETPVNGCYGFNQNSKKSYRQVIQKFVTVIEDVANLRL
jgi:hypothetical protein